MCEVCQLEEHLNQALQGLLNEFYIYMSFLNVSVWCQALSDPVCGWYWRFRARWLGHEPGGTSLSQAEQAAGQCKDAVCEECGDGWRGGGRVVLLFLMSVHLIWIKTCRNTVFMIIYWSQTLTYKWNINICIIKLMGFSIHMTPHRTSGLENGWMDNKSIDKYINVYIFDIS